MTDQILVIISEGVEPVKTPPNYGPD